MSNASHVDTSPVNAVPCTELSTERQEALQTSRSRHSAFHGIHSKRLWPAGTLEPLPSPKTQKKFGDYGEIKEAEDSALCIPQRTTQEAIDALMQPSLLFLVKVDSKQPFKGAGLAPASKAYCTQ